MKISPFTILLLGASLGLVACGGSGAGSKTKKDPVVTAYSLAASIDGLEKGTVLTLTNREDGKAFTLTGLGNGAVRVANNEDEQELTIDDGLVTLYEAADSLNGVAYDLTLSLLPAVEKVDNGNAPNLQRCVLDNAQGTIQGDTVFAIHCTTQLFFAQGQKLWVSNGTTEGTVSFTFNDWLPSKLTVFGNKIYFGADGALWVSDGTAAGTNMVKDIFPGPGGPTPYSLTVVDNKLYFGANDDVHGSELWVSDGTAAGTNMVKDISSGSVGSYPNSLTVVDNKLYFIANDGVHGNELWVTDGTAAGTDMVKDILPGPGGPTLYSLTVVDNKLYFGANDGVYGSELWVSDGTAAGTNMVKDISLGSVGSYPNSLTVVDNKLYFIANDGVHGNELWVTDGTAAGTDIVKDILPGSASSNPSYLTAVNNKLYFSAYDGSSRTLWMTDGESTEKLAVKTPSSLTVLSNALYLVGNEGTEIWRIDSVTGTLIIQDTQGQFGGLKAVGDSLYYYRYYSGVGRLAVYNDTAADVNLNVNASFWPIGAIQGKAVFASYNGNCQMSAQMPALYITDGRTRDANQTDKIKVEKLVALDESFCN